jgi:hypothetical protein
MSDHKDILDDFINLSQRYSKLKADFEIINNIVKLLTFCAGNTVKDGWSDDKEQQEYRHDELIKIVNLLMRSHMCFLASDGRNMKEETDNIHKYSINFFKEMASEGLDISGFKFIEKITGISKDKNEENILSQLNHRFERKRH